jgi:integrase/recombinase XerD
VRDKSYQATKAGPDVAAFLAAFELKGRNPYHYESDLARMCLMYPDLPLAEITDAELAQVFRTFPPKGRRERVAKYRSFYRWARMTRRVAENPMDYLENPKRQPKAVYDIFTDAETELLLELPTVDAAPLALLFDAGLRRNELRDMTLRRCDPTGDYVNVIEGKGGKDRQIPLTARLRHLLADLQILEGVNPDDRILGGSWGNLQRRRTRRDHPVGDATFYRWWYRCLDTAGVRASDERGDKRNPHVARHTFATRWRRLGLDPDYLAYILGHESVRTTIDTYVHTDIQDVARTMRTLEPKVFA